MAPTIRWEESKAIKQWTYGYVGSVKAFTIERNGTKYVLQPHLPGKHGYPPQEPVASEQAARDRAEAILAEFLDELGAQLGPPRRSS